MLSKSLGSTNKVNIAYAVIEALQQLVPREKWLNGSQASAKTAGTGKTNEEGRTKNEEEAAKKPAAKKAPAKKEAK
jgi:hypothetical protein